MRSYSAPSSIHTLGCKSECQPPVSVIDIKVGVIVVSLAADVLAHVRRCTVYNICIALLLFLDDA